MHEKKLINIFCPSLLKWQMKVKDSGKLALLDGTGYRTKHSIDAANKQLAHFVELLEVRNLTRGQGPILCVFA